MNLMVNSICVTFSISAIVFMGACTDTPADASVPPPAGIEELASNLPPGMTLVTDNQFTVTSGQDPATGAYWGIASNRQGEIPTIEIDPTAPSGNERVFRQSYAGVEDGHEPMFPSTGLGVGNEVFIAMHVKFDELWENPQNSGIKWHITNAMQGGDGSQTAGWFGIGRESETNTAEPNLHWVFNGTCADCVSQPRSRLDSDPPAAGNLTRGEWHKVQYYLSKDPGRIAVWVNDVLIIDHSGFTWTHPAGTWQSFQMGATWGGGIGHAGPENNRIYYDRVIIWRR